MLAAMILFAQISTGPAPQVHMPVPAVVLTSHERHAWHERHLAHLAYVRELASERQEARRHDAPPATGAPAVHVTVTLSGHLGCGGLESLWVAAGGSKAEAFIAAEVAMAESSGDQFATGPAGERGYWQIHPDHGSLSTYDPYGNARAAVIISDDGRSWLPWTTYVTGAYIGRCLQFASAVACRAGLAVFLA